MKAEEINYQKIIHSYGEEINNIQKLIYEIDKEILFYEKNKDRRDPDDKKIYLFNKNEKIRLEREVEAKQLFFNAYTGRVNEYTTKRNKEAEEIRLKFKLYFKIAKRCTSDFKLKTDQRNRFKKILKRFNENLNEEELRNFYQILKQELLLIKKIQS